MKTVKIFMKSGHVVEFQTNIFRILFQTEYDEEGNAVTINKIAAIEVTKKERGVSYEYCDYDDIAAITSDTSA
jgi:hypothetical protein